MAKTDSPTRMMQAIEHLAFGHGSSGMQVRDWPAADDHTDDCPGCKMVKAQAAKTKLAEQDKAKADAAMADLAVKAARAAQDKAIEDQKKLAASSTMPPSSVTGMPPEPPAKDKK